MLSGNLQLAVMGDDEDVGPTCGIGTFCVGLLLVWPAAIILTGYNEQAAVCREWAIDQAKDTARSLTCSSASKDADGQQIATGTLGFLSCDVDKSTYKQFTSQSFAGLQGISVGSIFKPADAKAAAMSMDVQMWQCYETCAREECYRRLDETDGTASPQGHGDAVEDRRSLLTRRLGDVENGATTRNLKSSSSKSCTPRCVEYRHERRLTGDRLSQSFHDEGGARAVCGDTSWSYVEDPKMGVSYVHAAKGEVQLSGKKWKLNDFQIQGLPIDVDVTLPNREGSNLGPVGGTLTNQNTRQSSNKIYTCAANRPNEMGCLEISFKKAVPNTVTIFSATSKEEGFFSDEGWFADGYWLCSGSSSNHINRACPASTSVSFFKGVTSCGEDVNTMDKLTSKLANENNTKLWGIRIAGFILFWCSISMCFQPIRSLLGCITNSLDSATDCIPCVGWIVDTMTDIFMGVVKAVLCIVSFCCAGGCFLFVVAFMWMVLRPVQGSILMVVMCCCCCGGVGLLYSGRDPEKGAKARDKLLKGMPADASDDEDMPDDNGADFYDGNE